MITKKYVIPSRRNQQLPPPSETPKRQTATGFSGLNEDDFKPLVNETVNRPTSLTNWKSVVNDNTSLVSEIKFKNRNPHKFPSRSSLPYPQPRRYHDYEVKEEKYVDSDEPVLQPEESKTDDDGWTLVKKEKKVYPKRDKIQEALDNGDAPLSESESDNDYFNDEEQEYQKYFD